MWVVDLAIIALLAAFLAAGVDHFLQVMVDGFLRTAVADTSGEERRPGSGIQRPDEPFERVDGRDILARNIFDSVTGPLDREVGASAAPLDDEAQIDADLVPHTCNPSLSLLASYCFGEHAEHSFVAIRSGQESEILQVGDTIDGHNLESITWRYAFLSTQDGTPCYLDVWAKKMGSVKPGKKKTALKGKGKQNLQALLGKTIKNVSPTVKDVDRSLVEYLVQNKQALLKAGRVLPNVEGNKVNGLKMYGIRKTSLWGKLGLHNGDVLLSVNGQPISGAERIYKAFAGLGGKNVMRLNLERHGKSVTITLKIK
jgi:general secretion pathway protein C